MCGIAGLIMSQGAPPPDAATLAAMIGSLTHRGPDGSGHTGFVASLRPHHLALHPAPAHRATVADPLAFADREGTHPCLSLSSPNCPSKFAS